LEVATPDPTVRAPGTLAAHYAPAARLVLVERDDLPAAIADAATPVALLAPADVVTPEGVHRLAAPEDSAAYARSLYAALRAADADGIATIVAVAPAVGVLAAAVHDRLHRAAVGSARER
jgi:L-threonylcarbamoyladenylate synthase